MITIILLHSLQSIPIQKWTFESNSPIKIGRANNNDIVLYSAVVSRYHLEIRPQGSDWLLISKGANGTFFEGKNIHKILLKDGMIFRLASSGPKIQIRLKDMSESDSSEPTLLEEQKSKGIRKEEISKATVFHDSKDIPENESSEPTILEERKSKGIRKEEISKATVFHDSKEALAERVIFSRSAKFGLGKAVSVFNQSKYSILPAGPVMGDQVKPPYCQPISKAVSKT